MSVPFLLGTDFLRKIQSVRPDRLVSLWPQNEPSGAVSTEIVRGYHGAYIGVTLGQTGLQGTGMTCPFFDGANDYNDIYTAGFANDNAILNPGFETPGAGPPEFLNWVDTVGDGAIDTEGVVTHEGAAAAKLTAGALRNTQIRQDLTVVAGERYRLRFWSRGDGVNLGRYYIYDDDNGVYIGAIISVGAVGAYDMHVREFVAPVGCTTIRLVLLVPNVNLAFCYFDACEVRRLDGFLGDEGTVIVPARVSGVGVWTDGIKRNLIMVYADGTNYILIRRALANNTMEFIYVSGGVSVIQVTGGLANLDFALYGITWDTAAGATGEVRYYIRGLPSGLTDVGLGTWESDLDAARTLIGAGSTAPTELWSGNIAPVAVWSTALPPDAMRYLGTV